MKSDLWHPNIKYHGKEKGHICSNAKDFGKRYNLYFLAHRIGEILQYKNYHAIEEPPHPDDEIVAEWVREYAEPKDIVNKDILVELARHQGHDGQAFLDGIETPAIKAYLKEITDHAADRGVFGAPFFLIGDEPFWGVDRLSLMGYYLEHGEWPQKP